MKKNPKVSVIILNWNGREILDDCLKSWKKVRYLAKEIIVVNNGSTDDSAEFLKKNYKNVKVIEIKKNVWFAKANNIGLKHATGKYILFLNNDTTVTPDFLKPLVDDLEKDKILGAVQPKIRQMGDSDRLDSIGSFFTSTGFLYHYGYGQNEKEKKFNKRMEIFSAKGACFLVRRSLIEKIGLFDEDFFAYFEESDFCHRIWLSGHTIIYEPKSEIYHVGGVDNRQSSQAKIQFHSYKNRINSYTKNLEIAELIKLLPGHLMLCLVVSLSYLIMRRPRISIAIMKAISWNIINLSKTLKKRKMIQKKIRKIRDRDYLKSVKKDARLSYYYFILTKFGIGDYEFDEI